MNEEQFEFMIRTLRETDLFKLHHETIGEMQIYMISETLGLLEMDGFEVRFDDVQYVEAKHLLIKDSDILMFKLCNQVIARVRADYLSFCGEEEGHTE